MLNKNRRLAVLLLSLAITACGLTQAQAADSANPADTANPASAASSINAENKKVYEIKWAEEDLSTPMSWVESPYFNNPLYKETRFENYNDNAPIPPGGPRETSFYMVYRADGLYMFLQSNEPETDPNGNLKESWLEMFVVTGEGDLPYHQMIVPTSGNAVEYYEWQTEYRDNRPLKGSVKINSGQIPGGWGTVVIIPWENVYDALPLNGGNWQFNVIRWSPSDGQTWGGQVHQPGRFNLLHFQAPTAEQRMAIQKYVLTYAWSKFQTTSDELTAAWFNNDNKEDKDFFNGLVRPMLVEGKVKGNQMHKLDRMNPAETDELFQTVPEWMELRYNVDDQRQQFLKNALFGM
ncbi:hypothetical protein [Paenibacillus spongiae]|uniref:Carbohydrate-binding domain-containing protein n=1 Tax=Paenibacillus spongiae TaxID=2909671 RepID=A0ABY5S3A0_9BACL|nr:hypothetical protein [Paenibacillus spongiae]UVI27310.1 hypothetical protein L1F29_17665 [Paenibacillus spongiae]